MTMHPDYRSFVLEELVDEQGSLRPLYALNHRLLRMAEAATLEGDRPLAAALLEAGRAGVEIAREYGEGLLVVDELRDAARDDDAGSV